MSVCSVLAGSSIVVAAITPAAGASTAATMVPAGLIVYSEILRAWCPITMQFSASSQITMELSAASPIDIARALVTTIDLEQVT